MFTDCTCFHTTLWVTQGIAFVGHNAHNHRFTVRYFDKHTLPSSLKRVFTLINLWYFEFTAIEKKSQAKLDDFTQFSKRQCKINCTWYNVRDLGFYSKCHCYGHCNQTHSVRFAPPSNLIILCFQWAQVLILIIGTTARPSEIKSNTLAVTLVMIWSKACLGHNTVKCNKFQWF